jgi:hypothetical protein
MKTVITTLICIIFLLASAGKRSELEKVYQLFISTSEIPVFFFMYFEHDTLTRPTWRELASIPIGNLSDTITWRFVHDNFEKRFTDQIDENGNLRISLIDDTHDFIQRTNYIFPLVEFQTIDDKTIFEIDSYILFSRESPNSGGWRHSRHHIHNRGDSIITFSEGLYDVGGTTPEGRTFRFAGEQIDSIQVHTEALFYIAQGFDINGRDDWGWLLYNLETEWLNTRVDNNSYTMPMINEIFIDANSFSKIRNKALAVQREVLIENRELYFGESVNEFSTETVTTEIIRNPFPQTGQPYYQFIREKFKPNLDDAKTADELFLVIGLKHFVNYVTVFYKNGKTREFVHIAGYSVSVP